MVNFFEHVEEESYLVIMLACNIQISIYLPVWRDDALCSP